MLILVIVRHRRADMVKKTNGIYFPEERLCKWFAQLLLAVNYLHSSRVLHRDLKMAKMDIITRWVLSSWDNQLYVVTFQEARKLAFQLVLDFSAGMAPSPDTMKVIDDFRYVIKGMVSSMQLNIPGTSYHMALEI
ncbi:hypothetical protein O6H91_07G014900 [Diphasiastrum complanatum]|uniref:Uncharacterized protein n=1 Tax=Diphasiastrum complanatum TaxID=34168 RepID=A0ACC2D2M8_DIPCM|nr:hypothetical protein O6H91_07G014900 [Diphasiastrum complanatum]